MTRVVLAICFSVLALTSCRLDDPCGKYSFACPPSGVPAVVITTATMTPTYLPTIPVTIWTHTAAPSGSGKAQPTP